VKRIWFLKHYPRDISGWGGEFWAPYLTPTAIRENHIRF
jgi:hypothetical protein